MVWQLHSLFMRCGKMLQKTKEPLHIFVSLRLQLCYNSLCRKSRLTLFVLTGPCTHFCPCSTNTSATPTNKLLISGGTTFENVHFKNHATWHADLQILLLDSQFNIQMLILPHARVNEYLSIVSKVQTHIFIIYKLKLTLSCNCIGCWAIICSTCCKHFRTPACPPPIRSESHLGWTLNNKTSLAQH